MVKYLVVILLKKNSLKNNFIPFFQVQALMQLASQYQPFYFSPSTLLFHKKVFHYIFNYKFTVCFYTVYINTKELLSFYQKNLL